MNDLDKLKAKLVTHKTKWPIIQAETGITQRTMYNIVNNKMPNSNTVTILLAYFKGKK